MGSATATKQNAMVTRTIPDPNPTGAEFIRLEVFAPMFQLNYQSTDLYPSASAVTTMNITTSSNGAPFFPTAAPSNDSRTISSGAIAGIAIAAVLIAIGLGVFGFVVWRRRRRLGTKVPPSPHAQELESKTWRGGRLHGAELPSQRQVHEIGAPEVYELPAQSWSHGPDASDKSVKAVKSGLSVKTEESVRLDKSES